MAGARTPATVTWLGHATALVGLDGARVLTDPVLRDRVGHLRRVAAPVDSTLLARLDAVVISHLHADHADGPSLRMLSPSRVIAPRGSRGWLVRQGIGEIEELAPGEETEIAGVRAKATTALHDHRRWPLGRGAQPMGLVLNGSRTVYFAGDTDLFGGMAQLAGRMDVALLPIWGWGRRVGRGHLDPARAARAVRLIAPRVVVPIHWGTFAPAWRARRKEDRARPARLFSELVGTMAVATEVRVLAPGESTELAVVPGPRV
jgi:L-ascorbate metabolism protein UlaG (beta-lactamase superfamily)